MTIRFQSAAPLRARIAPTEDDTNFRKRLLQGEVHDENAWALGGVAGHAGLFCTAGDVAAFAQMLLNGGIYAHHRLLTRAMIQQFTARQTVGDSARTLGWDVPTPPTRRRALSFRPAPLDTRVHRNFAVDRPGTRPFRGAAYQSRESHARQRKDSSGAARAFTTRFCRRWAWRTLPLPLDNFLVTQPAGIHYRPHTGRRLSV